MIGGIVQVAWSIPGLCVGIAASNLLLYLIYQEQLISTDPLTGLNNRNRFETYMQTLFSECGFPKTLIRITMDFSLTKKSPYARKSLFLPCQSILWKASNIFII